MAPTTGTHHRALLETENFKNIAKINTAKILINLKSKFFDHSPDACIL
jgi:hypothetical protein